MQRPAHQRLRFLPRPRQSLAILLTLSFLPIVACDSASQLTSLQTDANQREDASTWREPLSLLARTDAANNPAELPSGPPYPIALVHGFSGFNSLGPLEYFFAVVDDLAEAGETQIFTPVLPPYNSVEERATFLQEAIVDILNETGAAKVHLIAHSQGGLDARYIISVLGMAPHIASLTTIATPHRGTPLADYVLNLPENSLDPVARTLAWVIGALESPDAGGDHENDNWQHDMDKSAHSLSAATRSAYNDAYPDDPRVPIFSVAAVSNLQTADEICANSEWGELRRFDVIEPLLVGTATVLSGWNPFRRRPNDGIVPTASMPWGHFLGCVPADHFDQVGQIADMTPHLISGFDHRTLYRDLVARLRSLE